MGINLEVDLTEGSIEKVKGDPQLVKDFLGGQGINAKILWDRVGPEVDAFSPDNLLIFGTGILCGTPTPSANRTTVTYKSPVIDTHAWSVMGGFFATELKQAGYDIIIIRGKSPTPVYLWINNDQVEIRDAGHLWGEDTRRTQELIREELQNDKVQSACIGPAGENRVYAASIEHATGATASRGGAGAIMGDKNLKAIAIYGSNDVSIANPDKFIESCEQVYDKAEKAYEMGFKIFGKAVTGALASEGAPGNFSDTVSPELMKQLSLAPMMDQMQDMVDQRRTREVACCNCFLRCKWAFSVPEGGQSYFKCQALATIMISSKIVDTNFAVNTYNLCERLGLDAVTTSNTIAYAIDLYEKGILTKEDTDGVHLEWENPEVVSFLINKVARREGIGDALANGLYRAAQQIGKGAEKHVQHTKKQDYIPYDLRTPWYALISAVNEKGDLTRLESAPAVRWEVWTKEQKEAYLKTGFFPFPEEFKKYYMMERDYDDIEWGEIDEALCQIVSYVGDAYILTDAAGLCAFWTIFHVYPPLHRRTLVLDFISGITGMDIDGAEALKIAQRTGALVRAYNAREGMGRKDDTFLEKYFEKSTYHPHHHVDRGLFTKWVDRFYELKGWNNDGIPTKQTLDELGLDYVRQELEERGIPL